MVRYYRNNKQNKRSSNFVLCKTLLLIMSIIIPILTLCEYVNHYNRIEVINQIEQSGYTKFDTFIQNGSQVFIQLKKNYNIINIPLFGLKEKGLKINMIVEECVTFFSINKWYTGFTSIFLTTTFSPDNAIIFTLSDENYIQLDKQFFENIRGYSKKIIYDSEPNHFNTSGAYLMGFRYIGNGYFLYKLNPLPLLKWNECNKGNIRIHFVIYKPEIISIIGIKTKTENLITFIKPIQNVTLVGGISMLHQNNRTFNEIINIERDESLKKVSHWCYIVIFIWTLYFISRN